MAGPDMAAALLSRSEYGSKDAIAAKYQTVPLLNQRPSLLALTIFFMVRKMPSTSNDTPNSLASDILLAMLPRSSLRPLHREAGTGMG